MEGDVVFMAGEMWGIASSAEAEEVGQDQARDLPG